MKTLHDSRGQARAAPNRMAAWAVLTVCALTAGGCSVPAQMRIENAGDPRHEDKDVRFRTTYYFRVFDHCADAQTAAAGKRPRSDTLYRFRMTGKANSLTTQVHFESGTLTAAQIDPFGANVVYDERNRQFSFKSQSETQLDARRERNFDDLQRLLRTYDGLRPTQPAAPETGAAGAPGRYIAGDPKLNEAMREVIGQRILSLKDQAGSPALAASAAAAGGAGNARVDECVQSRRGFQILGPEGWRSFNQDERLLLAMSSSGRPLISTMQEISGRVLNNQPIEAEMLLPLVREDLRISRAEHELDKFTGTNPQRAAELLAAAIKHLGGTEAGK